MLLRSIVFYLCGSCDRVLLKKEGEEKRFILLFCIFFRIFPIVQPANVPGLGGLRHRHILRGE